MGNRLAPILAILFLDRIENQAIYADLSISLFYRYFDDCIAPASSYEEAYKIQNHLNCQEPSIRYEIELPGEDGFLPFLNTKVRVNDSGIVETGWYTKPANKGLMLNAKSHHPEHIKHAVINNTINTYTSICSTNTLLQEATDSFKTRAQRNGYSPQYINQVRSKPKKLPRHHREPLPTLTIPYISSAFTNDIKKALKRCNLDIRLVQRPQRSLKISSSNQDLTTKHVKRLLNATSVETRHQHLKPTAHRKISSIPSNVISATTMMVYILVRQADH